LHGLGTVCLSFYDLLVFFDISLCGREAEGLVQKREKRKDFGSREKEEKVLEKLDRETCA
jgi:hypothetical protein